jgi:hypothetical protein
MDIQPATPASVAVWLAVTATIALGVWGSTRMRMRVWSLVKRIGFLLLWAGLGIAGLSLVACIGMYLFWPEYPEDLYRHTAYAFGFGLCWALLGYILFGVGHGIPKQ